MSKEKPSERDLQINNSFIPVQDRLVQPGLAEHHQGRRVAEGVKTSSTPAGEKIEPTRYPARG
jgi:hypothetical protein